ncbi:lipid-binding protein [Tamilnaduibacter salinus]|uniref:Lipid-binding protein n=2 Tax=Tamilnaduibacter salinus TaxID=1484056 RepID=A0A2A2I7C3_9GAMM|nr:lipid-binding protein [Tamilnaduibacter salinus]
MLSTVTHVRKDDALRFIVCLLILLIPGLALAGPALPSQDADWAVQQDSDGIVVETADLPGSDFQAFRASTTFDVPVSRVMAVMAHPQSCMKWVHNCTAARNLSGTFRDRFAYSVNDMPWPVSDRDYVLHVLTRGEPGSGTVEVRMSAVKGHHPKQDGMVRVTKSDTLYRFTPVGNGQTRMTWVQHTEPNGSIPSWLVNSLLVDIPFQSVKALRDVVHEPRYAGHRLVFHNGKLTNVVKRPDDSGDDAS